MPLAKNIINARAQLTPLGIKMAQEKKEREGG